MTLFGIFGTGLMARTYARILRQRPDCALVAVVGNSEEKTTAFGQEFGVAAYAGGDYDQMFRKHPEILNVIITTPEWVRTEPVSAAVRHGVNILLEKPFATSLSDSMELKRMLSEHRGVFEICHVLRHSPRFHAAYEAVRGGQIGEIRHIYARRHSNNRRVLRVLGKAPLAFWLTPHDVDIMRWLTGSEVSEVFARSRNGLGSADDYLISNLRFANGVDAVLEISWCTPPTSGSARTAGFEVWGTGGTLTVDDSEMNVRIYGVGDGVTAADTYEDVEIHGIRQGIFKNMMERFIARVVNDERNPEALPSAVESVRVCDMIARSVAEGRLVVRD